MFCPKCSRPVADGAQYCQQCGLAVEGVRRLVEGGGDDAKAAAAGAKARPVSPRGRGYRRGFQLLMLALLALPLYPAVEAFFGWLLPSVENTEMDELPVKLFVALLFGVFIAGLLRMLYARVFEGAEPSAVSDAGGAGDEAPRMFGAFRRRALPPRQSIPVEEFAAGRASTADLARPRSVTEHTTRSLRAD